MKTYDIVIISARFPDRKVTGVKKKYLTPCFCCSMIAHVWQVKLWKKSLNRDFYMISTEIF